MNNEFMIIFSFQNATRCNSSATSRPILTPFPDLALVIRSFPILENE